MMLLFIPLVYLSSPSKVDICDIWFCHRTTILFIGLDVFDYHHTQKDIENTEDRDIEYCDVFLFSGLSSDYHLFYILFLFYTCVAVITNVTVRDLLYI